MTDSYSDIEWRVCRRTPDVATRIDWSTVESQIRFCKNEYGWDTRSKALSHVILHRLFQAEFDDVEAAMTDGAQDRGIDAVLIEESCDSPRVHLFQVKCADSF